MADIFANPLVKTVFQADTVVKEEILETEDKQSLLNETAISQSNIRKSLEKLCFMISPKMEVNDDDNESDINVSVLHEEVDLGISVIDSKEDIKLTGLKDSMLLDIITKAIDSGSRTNPTRNNSPLGYASSLLEVDRQLRKRKAEHNNSGAMLTKMKIESSKKTEIIDQKIEYRNNPRKLVAKSASKRAPSTWMLNPVVMLTPLVKTNSTNEFLCVKCNSKLECKDVIIQHLSICYRSPSHNEQTTVSNRKCEKDLGYRTGERTFACDECDYSCYHKSNLRRHLKTHTGEKPYACDECDYTCAVRSSLQIHSRTHTGERPFACNECGFTCTVKGNLQIHSRIHTGKKPFACNECDYTCSVKSSLQIHSRTHTGEKPFACKECDYTSACRSNLQRHSRMHTGEKPYACDICNKIFGNKGHLRRHINTTRSHRCGVR